MTRDQKAALRAEARERRRRPAGDEPQNGDEPRQEDKPPHGTRSNGGTAAREARTSARGRR